MHTRRRRRSGNIAVLFALCMTVILAVGSLTIDLGYARTAQQQLQDVADAAAMGAARSLNGTAAGITNARSQAQRIAAANTVAGQTFALDANTGNAADGDIVIGVWSDGVFTPSTSATQANAVRMHASVAGIDTFFAKIAFGKGSMTAGADSTAKALSGNAGGVSCFLPIAMPLCELETYGKSGLQSRTLKLNPPGLDNIGWVRPDANPSAAWLKSQLTSCTADGATTIADTAYLQNGMDAAVGAQLASTIASSSTRWSSAWGAIPARQSGSAISATNYGKTLEGPMIIFDGGPSFCTSSGGNFTKNYPTVGYVWGAIYDLKTSGAAATRNMYIHADTSTVHAMGTQAGGVDAGVTVTASGSLVE